MIRREHPSEVAERGRSQERIGRRVEDHVAVRMAVQPGHAGKLEPSESERGAGAKGVRIHPSADPSVLTGGHECRGASEVGGQGHLEIHGVSGHGMDADCTGHHQRRFIGEPLTARCRVPAKRFGQQARPGPLGRLASGEIGSIDQFAQLTIAHPPDGVADGNHGQGSPVLRRRGGHGVDQVS